MVTVTKQEPHDESPSRESENVNAMNPSSDLPIRPNSYVEEKAEPNDPDSSRAAVPINNHDNSSRSALKQVPMHLERDCTIRKVNDAKLKDKAIMGTNDNCTVSKRSVERLYYEQPHFYRHFVKKPKTRAALINRGYWLRMQVIQRSLQVFLAQTLGSKRIILNLGCGYDALPFQLLATKPDLCKGVVFADVDYEELVLEKVSIIKTTEQLRLLLNKLVEPRASTGLALKSENYAAIACDLTDIDRLDKVIRDNFDPSAIYLVICEVSITYMDPKAADALIRWAASLGNARYPTRCLTCIAYPPLPDPPLWMPRLRLLVRFYLLEQITPNGPDHPFATAMLNHFSKLNSPLQVVEKYPKIEDQIQRFHAANWQSVSADSLWTLWNDLGYFSTTERVKLNSVELFDEWEEFVLFSSHYFFLTAKSQFLPTSSLGRLTHMADEAIQQQAPRRMRIRSDILACPPRRYGVLYESGKGVFDFHGGDDGKRRVASTDTFFLTPRSAPARLPDRPRAVIRAFSTVTPLTRPFDCLLVGGREAPQRPLSECWLRRSSRWSRVEDLPRPLFRHTATLIVDRQGRDGVLVFGGRTSQGELSAAWYLWQESTGWLQATNVSEIVAPRFGANLVSLDSRDTGLLLGGMGNDGSIQNECYSWFLETSGEEPKIKLEKSLKDTVDVSLCRLGASLVASPQGLLLVGGVHSTGLPAPGHEICRLTVSSNLGNQVSRLIDFTTLPELGDNGFDLQPLFIGHSSIYDGNGVVVIGGGATCFSFGNYMNSNIWRFDDRGKGEVAVWKLMRLGSVPCEMEQPSKYQKLAMIATNPSVDGNGEFIPIRKVKIKAPETFQKKVKDGRPFFFDSVDVGPCVKRWTTEYLKKAVGGEREFDIHHAQEDTMLFESRNFVIKKNTFPEFINAIVKGERRYLRSISSKDHRKPANFSRDFEDLAADFILTDSLAIPSGQVHSSVLRISGPINMWLHYDVMPNILCQIRGIKRLVLFPPEDVGYLKIPPGRSSSDLDVFDPKAWKRTPLDQTHPYEVILKPGDVLFIPALWCHSAIPLDGVSIAINTFFKAHDDTCYAVGTNTYGNRDVSEYEYSRRDIAKAMSRFDSMPPVMSRFYLERLGREILDKAHDRT